MDKFEKKGWKYGLIKVDVEYEGTDLEEQTNHLVELFPDENGNYTSFCDARIMSIEELEFALSDIRSDGINEYFFNNGKFNYEVCEKCYNSKLDWEEQNNAIETGVVKENEKGEMYLKLTSDILLQMGWTDGDPIELGCNDNGTFTLKKIDKFDAQQKCENSDLDEELYAVYGGD